MRYLIPEFAGMGDLIQKTPMIRTIGKLDQDAVIILVGDNRWNGLDVVKGSSLIHEICDVTDLLGLSFPKQYNNTDIENLYEEIAPRRMAELTAWLKGIKWDVFLDSCESDVPLNVARLIERSDSGKIYRHTDTSLTKTASMLSRLKNWRKAVVDIELIPVLKGKHDIDLNYDLLEAYLGCSFERTYETWVSIDADERVLTQWGLSKKKYICFQPGAANGASTPKTWHTENFVALSSKLNEYLGLKVVLLGDRGDQQGVISKYKWPEPIVNTAGETSINDLCSLIDNAACLVVHDSGIMHLANAMNVPLVALYGPTDFTRTRPLAKTSEVLYSRTPAFSVMCDSIKSEEKLAEEYPDHQAMSGITIKDVENSVRHLCRTAARR